MKLGLKRLSNKLIGTVCSAYGLAAAVLSADAERCARVAKGLRAGIVKKNCCQSAFIQAPWGGIKK